MTVAIMQPYFLPYIGYWQLVNAVDVFVIYDDVNYINRGYINRNSIVINGQKHFFTLELMGASQNKKINEIEVGHNQNKLLKMFELTYKKAPFFNDAFPLIETILRCNEKNLGKFLGHSLQIIGNYLKLNTSFLYSSHLKKDNSLSAQDKIINICQNLHAKRYVNSIGGLSLYDYQQFASNHIELDILETQLIKYKQFKEPFMPNLSILDIIMFNSSEDVQKLLLQYTFYKKVQ